LILFFGKFIETSFLFWVKIMKTNNNTEIVKRDMKGRIKAAKIKDPARPAISRRNNAEEWTKKDIKALSSLAKINTPTRVIGLKLGRTEASVRRKARAENISLKPVNRSPNKGRRSNRKA
jgi:hypothetical protein